MIRLLRAVEYCKLWHGGQTRKYTGEPYYLHPMEVAEILSAFFKSENVIIAGLFHDVLEDTNTQPEVIHELFGAHVLELVRSVTDASKPEDGNRAARKKIDLEHLSKADFDGKSIKLADLISNTRNIVKYDPNFAKVYLQEKEALLAVLVGGSAHLHQAASDVLKQARQDLAVAQ